MTRVLLIDNYDSFTHNLAHLVAGVTGALPRVVRNDGIDLAAIVAWRPDAIILSPGPGHPGRAGDVGVCAAVLRETALPVLGVCLGHQLLVHLEGGRVGRIEPMHGMQSAVFHDGEGLFAGVPQGFEAVRYHSLAALGELPPALALTAWTRDGIAMGARHRQRPFWGVQFHPESILAKHGERLIANFLKESGVTVPPHAQAAARAIDGSTGAVPRRRVLTRALLGFPDPERVFVALFGDAATAFWLDSSRAEPGLARFSFMGTPRADAPSLTYDAATRTTRIRKGEAPDQLCAGPVLDTLEPLLAAIAATPVADLPFAGGLVGYFGYGMKADLGSPNRHASELPDAQWMLIERFLAFDHERRALIAVGLVGDDAQEADYARWVDAIALGIEALPPLPPVIPRALAAGDTVARLDHGAADYVGAIEQCLEQLRAGESYELCLTTRGSLPPLPAPLDYYRVLRAASPAPYAAYLRFDETALLCSSPERFLAAGADGRLSSRPIKGTAARETDPAADAAARAGLADSAKNRAENLMIADLVRNDFGRVCVPGSVSVPSLMEIESYATVHHMVTTIEGRLAPGRGVLDAVRACFPGGSMTGAPKPRSMAILDALERSARGIYSGSIGYLSADGAADLNIVIRTAVATARCTTFGVGGAIVALSDPADEYAEALLKADALLRAYALVTGQGAIAVAGPAEAQAPRAAPRDFGKRSAAAPDRRASIKSRR